MMLKIINLKEVYRLETFICAIHFKEYQKEKKLQKKEIYYYGKKKKKKQYKRITHFFFKIFIFIF